jgi:hypothetical protein
MKRSTGNFNVEKVLSRKDILFALGGGWMMMMMISIIIIFIESDVRYWIAAL